MRFRLVRAFSFIAALALPFTAQAAPAVNSILAGKKVTFVIDTTGPDAKVDAMIAAHLTNRMPRDGWSPRRRRSGLDRP